MLIILTEGAAAIGFGQLTTYSYLNQPLVAEFELIAADSYNEKQLQVRLADPKAYARQKLERPLILTDLSFTVIRWRERTVVHMTSSKPMKKPFLEFMVELVSPEGRLVKVATLLFDPEPLVHTARPQTVLEQRAAESPYSDFQVSKAPLTKRLITEPAKLYALPDEPTQPTSAMQPEQDLDLDFLKEDLTLVEPEQPASPVDKESLAPPPQEIPLFEEPARVPQTEVKTDQEMVTSILAEALQHSVQPEKEPQTIVEQELEQVLTQEAPQPALPLQPVIKSSSYLIQLIFIFGGIAVLGYVFWLYLEKRRDKSYQKKTATPFSTNDIDTDEESADFEKALDELAQTTFTTESPTEESSFQEEIPEQEIFEQEQSTVLPDAEPKPIENFHSETDNALHVAEQLDEKIILEEVDDLALSEEESEASLRTKLQLAHRYQQLGDHTNARALLTDVIAHAKPELQSEARTLLSQLPQSE